MEVMNEGLRRVAVIVLQRTTKSLSAPDRAIFVRRGACRRDEPIADSLMIALRMVEFHELVDRTAQVLLAKGAIRLRHSDLMERTNLNAYAECGETHS